MPWLEKLWYHITPLHLVLWPVSLLFAALAAVRRQLYRRNVFTVARLAVPVIVVGNISVGGTGKTPLVIWLAQQLSERGLNPGIVSRGYGGRAVASQRVACDSDPLLVGDEAVLLARRSGCPVWIGARRATAARQLLTANPDCNVIILDDGLQHYAIARDAEIAVIDAERVFGNGMLLPAGPLRESRQRLAEVDALVVNGAMLVPRELHPTAVPIYQMTLDGRQFRELLNPGRKVGPEHFVGRPLHAVAAIGNPQRFFSHLRKMGLSFVAHPFPDHHPLTASDLDFAADDAVIMTEKDAVKCERFRSGNYWVLAIDAITDAALCELMLKKIGT